MRFSFRLPWRAAAAQQHAVPERKTFAAGITAFSAEGRADWRERGYAALAREGFMRNPVAHRSIRLVAEAAASVPWQAECAAAAAHGN